MEGQGKKREREGKGFGKVSVPILGRGESKGDALNVWGGNRGPTGSSWSIQTGTHEQTSENVHVRG